MGAQIAEAETAAIALLTAASVDDERCAELATEVALADLDHRVLVAFCLVEASWSWAPPEATSTHPVHGPVLTALRADDPDTVRHVLTDAMMGKQPGSYAALLIQLAYATRDLVEDLQVRLPGRGLRVAAFPEDAGRRRVGPGWPPHPQT